MAAKSGSRVIPGHVEVPTAGTAVTLISGVAAGALREAVEKASIIGVYVSPDAANTEAVVVGDKNVKAKAKEQNGLVLPKGSGPVFLEVVDIRSLYVDAQKEKENLSFLVVVR